MADSERAFEYWRKRSDEYDAKYEDPSTVLEQEKRTRLASALELATFRDDDVVGEIGVGSGRLFARLPDGVSRAVGIDFSSDMIRTARAEQPEVDYLQGAASSLPLETDSLDVLFYLGVVGHMDPTALPAAVDEMARVVRPGGHLILSYANGRSPFRWLRRTYVRARNNGDLDYATYLPDQVSQLLEDAGYEVSDRRYLTYSTGLVDTRANMRLAASLDRWFSRNETLGRLAMTWVVSAHLSG